MNADWPDQVLKVAAICNEPMYDSLPSHTRGLSPQSDANAAARASPLLSAAIVDTDARAKVSPLFVATDVSEVELAEQLMEQLAAHPALHIEQPGEQIAEQRAVEVPCGPVVHLQSHLPSFRQWGNEKMGDAGVARPSNRIRITGKSATQGDLPLGSSSLPVRPAD